MSPEETLDLIEAASLTPEPVEVAEDTPSSAHEEAAEAAAPDTRRRLNHLDHERRRWLNLVEAEVAKHDKALAKIEEDHTAIEKARSDERNAHARLTIHIEQRDAALLHRREFEDKLREVNDEIRELSMTPKQRRERDAYRERERRRAEEERQRAEAAAAEAAAKEAYEAELVEYEQQFFRIPGRRRSEPDTWGIIAAHNRHVMVARRDLPQLERDHAEATAYFSRAARDELAGAYEAEMRQNGRPVYFPDMAARSAWLAQWGPNTPRAKAYRERQQERGLSDADPPKFGRPNEWVGETR
jgi:hypothetical protein